MSRDDICASLDATLAEIRANGEDDDATLTRVTAWALARMVERHGTAKTESAVNAALEFAKAEGATTNANDLRAMTPAGCA